MISGRLIAIVRRAPWRSSRRLATPVSQTVLSRPPLVRRSRRPAAVRRARPARTPGWRQQPADAPAGADAGSTRLGDRDGGARPGSPRPPYARMPTRSSPSRAACKVGWTTLAGHRLGRVPARHHRRPDARRRRALRRRRSSARRSTARTFAAIRGDARRARPGTATRPGTTPSARSSSSRRPGRPGARDGDGDGIADPNDLDDAAAAAARYLCADGHDLTTGAGWADAVFAYNHAQSYVDSVYAAASAYAERTG